MRCPKVIFFLLPLVVFLPLFLAGNKTLAEEDREELRNNVNILQEESCRIRNGCPGHCRCTIGDPAAEKSKILNLYSKRDRFMLWSIYRYGWWMASDRREGITGSQYLDVDVANGKCEVTNEIIFHDRGDRKEKDISDYFITKADCEFVPEKRDFCCCQLIESGEEMSSYRCEKRRAVRGSAEENAVCPIEGGKLSLEIPDGATDCSPLEKYGTVAPSLPEESLGLSPKKLKEIAVQKLNPGQYTSVPEFIGTLIGFLSSIIGTFALVMFIWAGVLWMTAVGNAEKLTLAKRIFVWTCIGVAATLAIYMATEFLFKAILG